MVSRTAACGVEGLCDLEEKVDGAYDVTRALAEGHFWRWVGVGLE